MTDWQRSAPCAGTDPELWFPDSGQPAKHARRICQACPYKAPCQLLALESGARHGIYGGLSIEQIRRQARQERWAS